MSGGADGQIGFKSEVTPGTAVVVDTFTPLLNESIKQPIQYMDSATISSRKTLRVAKQGGKRVSGGVSLELANTDLATLLSHMFGTVNTTGAGPYTHTATPGSLDGKALTVQVGRPAVDGTVHPFTYAGCKVASWTLAATVDQIATLDIELIGMTETTATGLAAASYDATWQPFTFVELAITVGGTSVASGKDLSLTGSNMVSDRVRIGSATSAEPLEIGVRDYSGELTTDFEGLTNYGLFTAGTETALVATFDNGTDSLVITMNVQFTGDTPELSGFDLLEQRLPFRCLSSTSDAAAITAVLINGEASAA